MKTLYLIRGLPGSGKSTLAKMLANYRHHEADAYHFKWSDEAEGFTYQWKPENVGEAHKKCQTAVERDMVGYAPYEVMPVPTIVVANTFTRQWEMEPYRVLARKYGYTVVELTVETRLSDDELSHRNIHNVPVASITAMRARWEH